MFHWFFLRKTSGRSKTSKGSWKNSYSQVTIPWSADQSRKCTAWDVSKLQRMASVDQELISAVRKIASKNCMPILLFWLQMSQWMQRKLEAYQTRKNHEGVIVRGNTWTPGFVSQLHVNGQRLRQKYTGFWSHCSIQQKLKTMVFACKWLVDFHMTGGLWLKFMATSCSKRTTQPHPNRNQQYSNTNRMYAQANRKNT